MFSSLIHRKHAQNRKKNTRTRRVNIAHLHVKIYEGWSTTAKKQAKLNDTRNK